MQENFKIFVWDGHNTGHYLQKFYQDVKAVRDYARQFAGNVYTIEGERGWFEKYENGEKTEWSAP